MAASSYIPLNMDNYLSQLGKDRKPSPIRELFRFLQEEDEKKEVKKVISLGAGHQNIDAIPIEEMSFKLKGGPLIELTKDEVIQAHRYGPTVGFGPLVSLVLSFQRFVHRPPLPDSEYSICFTGGSQDGFNKTFEILLNKGGYVLVEENTYGAPLTYLQASKCNLVGIKTDRFGIIPENLRSRLKELKAKGIKPHVLYLVPTGQNPSGFTYPTKRKQEIYDIACQYDFLIMEDDPHYFLYYGVDRAPQKDEDFKVPELKSFLSLDKQGRVIRFDSFSKTLSSGARLGFITAPIAFLKKFEISHGMLSVHTSGISQMFIYKFIQAHNNNNNNFEGILQYFRCQALFYARRRDYFLDSVEKYLGDLVSIPIIPDAGLSVFMQLKGIDDSNAFVYEQAIPKEKVLLVPGQVFHYAQQKSSFVRAAFSSVSNEEIDEALKRLAKLLKEQTSLDKKQSINSQMIPSKL